jgi:hypothetical protein
MIDAHEFFQNAQHDVRNAKAISKRTCDEFAELSLEYRLAYTKAMHFLGCESPNAHPSMDSSTSQTDRIKASKLMLLKLGLDSDEPCWSSWVLDRLLEAVMDTPGGGVSDLMCALYEVLDEHRCNLTETIRNLIKDLVIKCFMEHRTSFQTCDFRWMAQKTMQSPTPTQAYLALHAIPPDAIEPACSVAILRGLASSPYWEEALDTLSEELATQDAQKLLRAWAEDGFPTSLKNHLDRIIQNR